MWSSLIPEVLAEIRETERGGMAHACELETSVYLYLNARAVQMELAEKDQSDYPSEFHWQDLGLGAKVHFMDWWSRVSRLGIVGDPTRATVAKGKRAFEAAVDAVVQLAREFQRWPERVRRDLHQEEIR
jgi:creatinine amidohydrolase